jgi:hypothetical protein
MRTVHVICNMISIRTYSKSTLQRCCYVMGDFATAASQNGVCIKQQICHIMVLFLNFSNTKDKSNKNVMFCHDIYERKACQYKIRAVMQTLQHPPLCCSSTSECIE